MKKIIFTILIFTFAFSISFAGPFGLSKGMSVEEVSKLSEEGYEPTSFTSDDKYIFIPKKKHDLFKIYAVFIDKEKGLYAIGASSEEIETNDYGTELKNSFNAMVKRLSKIYGTPKIIDRVDSNSIFKNDNYWFSALKQGARELSATWEKGEKGTNLPEDLDKVIIHVQAGEFNSGFVMIAYRFSNAAEVQEKQDDVL